MTHFRINNGTPSISKAKLLTKAEYLFLKKKGFAANPYRKAYKYALISTQPRKYVVCTVISGKWMAQLKPISRLQLTKLRKEFAS